MNYTRDESKILRRDAYIHTNEGGDIPFQVWADFNKSLYKDKQFVPARMLPIFESACTILHSYAQPENKHNDLIPMSIQLFQSLIMKPLERNSNTFSSQDVEQMRNMVTELVRVDEQYYAAIQESFDLIYPPPKHR